MLNFGLLDNYFSNLFSEVIIWYLKTFKFGPGHFFRKIKIIPAETSLFLTMEAVNEDIKGRKKIEGNDRRNDLIIFDSKSIFLLTTSETKRDY